MRLNTQLRNEIRRAAVTAMLLATTAGTAALAPTAALAQSSSAVRSFDIPAQSLPDALILFGRQAGVEVTAESANTRGRSTQGISGNLSPAEALSRLLSGTGLMFRWQSDRAVVIEPAPQSADGSIQLGPVRVEGLGAVQASGAALSNPGLITEATNSYTTRAVTIGSNVPRSLRETPATVTVLSRKRIEDAAVYELEDILVQTPGVTVSAYSARETSIQSRGFALSDIRIDGSRITGDGWTFFDLSHYDHVEVLRGVDGLFGSAGQPGGTLNLSRKRALGTPQYQLALTAGSWNNYRVEGDITGPLNAEGTLRGRVLATYHNRDFHYDGSQKEVLSLYGRIEWDATPTTLVALGGAYERRQEDGYSSTGLMRYQTGEDLKLPRNSSFVPDWSYWNDDIGELFARVEQKIGESWRLNANLSYRSLQREVFWGYVYGGVAPDTGTGPALQSGAFDIDPGESLAADATLSGEFELFGKTHQILFGGEYRKYTEEVTHSPTSHTTAPPVDIFTFDRGAWGVYEAIHGTISGGSNSKKVERSAFASLRLNPTERFHVVAGARYTKLKSDSLYYSRDVTTGESVPTGSFNGGGNAFTPNAAVIWDFTKTLSLYGSYAKIRDFPGGVTISGDFLPPSNGRNLEIGLKGEFFDGQLNASLAAFQIDRTNLPIYVGYANGQYVYDTDGKQRSKGIEFDISGEILPGLQVIGGYAYNHNKDFDNNRQYNTATPGHMLRLWASYKATEKLELSGGVNWQSEYYARGSINIYDQTTNPWTVIRTESFNFTQGAFAVVNARVGYALTPNLSVSLNVNNIFDKTYYSTVGSSAGGNWYGEPRNVLLTVRARY